VCCLFLVASFVYFAADQAGGASKTAVAEINSPNPTLSPASKHHGQPRRFIDDVASTLTSPFRSILSGGSQWARELFLTICGLLLYGFGLGFLARYARGLP